MSDMKTKKYRISKILFLTAITITALNISCTDLDEELFGEVIPENFFKTEAEFVSALGAAYTRLQAYAVGDVYSLQEVTTDEMVVPTRGQDWDDGGNWRRLHLHSWTFEDDITGNAWDWCFAGVNTANRLIFQFQTLSEEGSVDPAQASSYIAELRALRGFFYWQLIDLYGNVPLVLDFESAEATPPTRSRVEVFNAIVSDLEAAVQELSRAVDGTTYARMNYYAGKMLLAKLYLNAEVYTGTPQWQAVINAADTIINSGKYTLEINYFTNFDVNSHVSQEFIFAIPYDKIFFTGFNLPMQTLHYGSQFTYNLTAQPWNGFCTLEEFYNSYDDNDLRKGEPGTRTEPSTVRGNFLAGYQFTRDGAPVIDDGAETRDPDGTHLNFGNIGSNIGQINELGPQALRQAGVRIGKWQFEIGGTTEMSNDYAVFRYADLLLMKAEALFRLGRANEALPLVNQIRARAGLTDLGSLDGRISFDLEGPVVTGGELFNEMGREMFAEHNRRQDLIRWDLWDENAKWALPYNNPGDVLRSDPYRSLFPINRAKLDANPNLNQNPGY
jgi:starch-binding outer membrane protein, SusD/RagB family